MSKSEVLVYCVPLLSLGLILSGICICSLKRDIDLNTHIIHKLIKDVFNKKKENDLDKLISETSIINNSLEKFIRKK